MFSNWEFCALLLKVLILNNLALVYYWQGRYEEAEPLYKQSLSLSQEVLGEHHPHVAQGINNLAALYSSQGRYEEAEPLYKQALSLSQEILGERHPHVATSIHNLAGLYSSQGRYEEAEPLYVRALQIAEAVLDRDHPNTAIYRKSLEILRQKQQTISLTLWQWIVAILMMPFYLLSTLILWLTRLFGQ